MAAIGIIVNKPLTESQRCGAFAVYPRFRNSGRLWRAAGGFGENFRARRKAPIRRKRRTGFRYQHLGRRRARQRPICSIKIRAKACKNGEQRYRVFTGYAGWGAFQLETEIHVQKQMSHARRPTTLFSRMATTATWDALECKQNHRQIGAETRSATSTYARRA